MTLTPLGTYSVGDAIPGLADAVTKLQSAAAQLQTMATDKNGAVADVQSKITNLQGIVGEAQSILSQGQALVTQAQGIATGAEGIVSDLSAKLGTAGVRGYRYEGPAANFGTELSAALGGDSAQVMAVVLLATDGGVWSALSSVLKV